jgi:hypothetical protein
MSGAVAMSAGAATSAGAAAVEREPDGPMIFDRWMSAWRPGPPAAAGALAPAWWMRGSSFTIPLCAALASLAVSWQCWINPFVDSGREVDVPWRLLQGERLYRSITYYYGPLGPWASASALRLVGNRWLAIELLCAALSALILLLLFRLTRRAGSLLAATCATALAAAVCVGAPKGGAFIFPYSSASLFALAGSLLALDAAAAAAGSWRRRLLGALGIAVALAARLDVGAAVCLTLVLAGLQSRPRRETWADLEVVGLGTLLACAAYGAACAGCSWADLTADGPLSPFVAMPTEWKALYLKTAGLARPWQAAGLLAGSLLLDGMLLAAAAWFALPRPERPWRRYRFALCGAALLGAYALSPWCVTASNLPPFVAILPVVAAAAALAWWRQPLDAAARPRFLLFALSAALAVRALFGMAIGPGMGPYLTLPLPGLLATAAILVFDVLAPRLPAPEVFRRRMAAVFAVVGVLFLYRLARLDHGPQLVEVETAAGALRLPSAKADAVAHTLQYLARSARAGDTLTAFPESGFFNFVTGLRSPLRQDLFVPGVLYGPREAAVAAQIDAAGPRFILLCNRPTPEYGPTSFGRDYAVQLWRTVERRYVLAGAFGPAPPDAQVGAGDFFIRIYRRAGAGTDLAAQR